MSRRVSSTPLRTARPRAVSQGGSPEFMLRCARVLGLPTFTPEQWAALRCLSIKDPWIRLVRLGIKPFELRRRPTHYRGPVVLCSSASPSRTLDARNARARTGQWAPDPFGMALCIGNLVNCFPADPRSALHTRHACCPPVAGEFVWEFRDVWALPKPLAVKGWLGLYTPPPDLRQQLRRLLA